MKIADTLITTPGNTKELMELKAFMEKVESETVYALDRKIEDAKNRLMFLVDYATFSPTEIRSNTATFNWQDRLISIFDEHRVIMLEKRAQFEEGLKVSSVFLECSGNVWSDFWIF